MDWFIKLEDATKVTIIALFLSNIVTIVIALVGYFQRKKELDINNEYSLKLLQEEKLQSRLDDDRKLLVQTFQNFASIAGNVLTSIELSNTSGIGRKISIDTLSRFDESYYKAYILLKSEDKVIFKSFQYKVRSLVGLPNPEGDFVWDIEEDLTNYQELIAEGYENLPQPVYEDFEKCLEICNLMITELLSESLSTIK